MKIKIIKDNLEIVNFINKNRKELKTLVLKKTDLKSKEISIMNQFTLKYNEERVKNKTKCLVYAYDNKEIIGWALLYDERIFFVKIRETLNVSIYVKKEYRDKKVGQRLLSEMILHYDNDLIYSVPWDDKSLYFFKQFENEKFIVSPYYMKDIKNEK